jgi:tetratricopeptide (TPR) repeat protein
MKKTIALLAVATVCLTITCGCATDDNARQTNANIAKDIGKSVTDLGYSKVVAQDLVRLVRDWKLDVWRQSISQARQQQKQASTADIARVEAEVIKELSRTIEQKIARDSAKELRYFQLSDVVTDKKAQCLGYSQLVYILGNSLGLRVTAIDVQELASRPLSAGEGHVACYVDLTDGKSVMVDLAIGIVSKPFVFREAYRAAGNYWELKQKDSLLGVHQRIRVLDRNGLVGRMYNNSAIRSCAAGDYRQALSCCTKAIELDSKNADAYSNRGSVYEKLGQLSNALSDCTKAIELDPKCATAYSNRGNAYRKVNQFAKAIPDYTNAIELDPKYAAAYSNRGVAYAESGQPGNALADYDRAIELDPTCAATYSNRGLAYLLSGQPAKAVSDYNKVIELNPKSADAYSNRGLANAMLGKTVEANNDLAKAVELNPAAKEKAKQISDQYKLGL